jgi:hypothetical protein
MPQHRARKLSPAIQRAVERRERLEREFTPIEKLFIESVSVLSQIGREIETEPEDTVFVIALDLAAEARAKKLEPGYTGI